MPARWALLVGFGILRYPCALETVLALGALNLPKQANGRDRLVCAMWENDALDLGTQSDLKREYGGTRLGRQELEGELLDDFEGAIFSRDDIEKYRIKREDMPKLTRVVVGVDPAMKPQDEDHDESGIVVAGEGEGPDGQNHVYVLDDLSRRGTTKQVMQTVAAAYDKWGRGRGCRGSQPRRRLDSGRTQGHRPQHPDPDGSRDAEQGRKSTPGSSPE
jgi:hypothetical protein